MINWEDNFRPDGTRVACFFCDKMIDGDFADLHNHIRDNHIKSLPKMIVSDEIPDNFVVLGSRDRLTGKIITSIQYRYEAKEND